MTSPAPMTEAEAAAARAIGGDFECTWHVGCDEECNADRARAVVAAVRGQIEADALEEAASMVESIPSIFVQRASVVDRLRKRAAARRQSLSLPASKETPDAR